jgi:hypothetical protein
VRLCIAATCCRQCVCGVLGVGDSPRSLLDIAAAFLCRVGGSGFAESVLQQLPEVLRHRRMVATWGDCAPRWELPRGVLMLQWCAANCTKAVNWAGFSVLELDIWTDWRISAGLRGLATGRFSVLELDIWTDWRISAGLRGLATGHSAGFWTFHCPVDFWCNLAELCQSVRMSGLRGGVGPHAFFCGVGWMGSMPLYYTYVLIFL